MPKCDRCGFEAENPGKFCINCGTKFVPRPEPVSASADGAFFCQKHAKEVTYVSCGRCERPICHKCTVVTSAGVRCRDCAKNKRPVRLRGVLHNAGAAIGPMDQKKIWYLYLLSIIARMFGGWWR